MKIYIYFLILMIRFSFARSERKPLTLGGHFVKENRFNQDAIVHQLFEMLRNLIKTGDSAKDIQIMDPIQFDDIEKHFEGRIFKIDADFTNASLSGLSAFTLLKSNFDKNALTIDVEIFLPSLLFVADNYKMDGDIFNKAVPLAGEGKIHFEFLDVRFCGKVYLKQSADGKSILIDKFDNAQFNINGFLSLTDIDGNIDEIFNAMLEDLVPYYMQRFNNFIISILSAMFIESFNSILIMYETWQIIAVIL